MGNKNIIFNHTLEQYNKKYRNRRYRLLKITKKEVDDFDKKNPTTAKGYLLKDRKWWLIGDTYYEIPKAPRYTWFRNLNAACQIGTCVLAAGMVAAAITVPLVLLNQQVEPEVSIESVDKVEWSNKHYDKDGNACLTIKGKGDNKIESLEINIENYKCIENTDFTYNKTTGELVVKKACVTAHPGKINIVPKFEEPVGETLSYEYVQTSDSYEVYCKDELKQKISDIVIPSTHNDGVHGEKNVTGIFNNEGIGGFENSTIKNVTMPATIKSISDFAFLSCGSLESVVVSNNIESIGKQAFLGCSKLSSIDLSKCNNLKTIGESAFGGCKLITNVVIPNSVVEIDKYAFFNSGLSTATFADSTNVWDIRNFEGTVVERYTPSDPSTNATKLLNQSSSGGYSDYKWVKTVTKKEWIDASDALYEKFNKATTKYSIEQISNVEYKQGNKGTFSGAINKIEYTTETRGEKGRVFKIYVGEDTNGEGFAGPYDTKGSVLDADEVLLDIDEGGHYIINSDGSLYYYIDEGASGQYGSWYIELKINKHGYITDMNYTGYGYEYYSKATYTGDPHEATPKDKFLNRIDEWCQGETGFKNATTKYLPEYLQNVIINGESVASSDITIAYEKPKTTGRTCKIIDNNRSSNQMGVGSYQFNTEYYKDYLLVEEEGHTTYTFTDDEIKYKTDKASTENGSIIELVFNKFGYKTKEVYYWNGVPVECSFSTIKDPEVITTLNLDYTCSYTGLSIPKGQQSKITNPGGDLIFTVQSELNNDVTNAEIEIYDEEGNRLGGVYSGFTIKPGSNTITILNSSISWGRVQDEMFGFVSLYNPGE